MTSVVRTAGCNMKNASISLSPAAELASYAGVVPFIACMVAMLVLPSYELRDVAQRIAVACGAIALAFAGAVHWGLMLAGRLPWGMHRLLGSLLPAACAIAAVVLDGQRGLGLLVAGLGVFWLYEHRIVGSSLPEDYLKLRRNLSLAVCALLAITMILSESVGLS